MLFHRSQPLVSVRNCSQVAIRLRRAGKAENMFLLYSKRRSDLDGCALASLCHSDSMCHCDFGLRGGCSSFWRHSPALMSGMHGQAQSNGLRGKVPLHDRRRTLELWALIECQPQHLETACKFGGRRSTLEPECKFGGRRSTLGLGVQISWGTCLGRCLGSLVACLCSTSCSTFLNINVWGCF